MLESSSFENATANFLPMKLAEELMMLCMLLPDNQRLLKLQTFLESDVIQRNRAYF